SFDYTQKAEDYATAAYNASTGSRVWSMRYKGPGGPGAREDIAGSLAVSPDGTEVFVTGASNGGLTTYEDYATVAYKASTGTKLWVARYDGPDSGVDGASSLAVSPDGTKVFVTGSSDGVYATIAYSAAAGAQLWVSRYDGP